MVGFDDFLLLWELFELWEFWSSWVVVVVVLVGAGWVFGGVGGLLVGLFALGLLVPVDVMDCRWVRCFWVFVMVWLVSLSTAVWLVVESAASVCSVCFSVGVSEVSFVVRRWCRVFLVLVRLIELIGMLMVWIMKRIGVGSVLLFMVVATAVVFDRVIMVVRLLVIVWCC